MNTETLHLILSAGLVAAAAALDVAANLMLARSDGFKKRLIGIAALALVGLAFYCLSLAVQYMDLAVAYSMWAASASWAPRCAAGSSCASASSPAPLPVWDCSSSA